MSDESIEQELWAIVENLRSTGNLSTIEAFYRVIDELRKVATPLQGLQFACTAGCAQCCHTLVSLSATEAEGIREYLSRRPALFKRLRAQIEAGIASWRKFMADRTDPNHDPDVLARDWAGQPCMFLNRESQECEIYEFRPIACRTYASKVRCTSPIQPEATGYVSDAVCILYRSLLEDEQRTEGRIDFAPLPVWMARKLKDRL